MRGCTTFFYRTSSIAVLLGLGLWLSSQTALADSFDWRSVNGQNWNTPDKKPVWRDVLGFLLLRHASKRNTCLPATMLPLIPTSPSSRSVGRPIPTWAARAAAGELRS